MDDSDRRLITVEEAARFLGLKVSTIRRLTARGELPCVRPTGRRAVRYRLRDLEDLARLRSAPMHEARRRPPEDDPERGAAKSSSGGAA